MKTNNKGKNFNIVIAGVGGQGIITLTMLIAESAFIEGYDVKTSELHGLSQRGGSVQTHIRLGKKIYSPLVPLGEADLIIGLEVSEALRNISYSNKNTLFFINENEIFYPGSLKKQEVVKKLNFLVDKKNVFLINASKICKEKFNKEVLAGVYLLGKAVFQNAMPFKKESVFKAISRLFKKSNYQKLNKDSFLLAEKI